MQRDRALGAAVLPLALLCSGCLSEIVVRMHTTVYAFGGIERRVEMTSRDAEGKPEPEEDELLELARPDRWRTVDRQPGSIVAEGHFAEAGDLFAPVDHVDASSRRGDRTVASLEHDDLVIVDRWRYQETYGDTHGPAELMAALSAATDWLAAELEREVRRDFGDAVDVSNAQAFIRGDVTRLVVQVLDGLQRSPEGIWTETPRVYTAPALRGAGAPLVEATGQEFWAEQIVALLDWARVETAGRLSGEGLRISPDELLFWPTDPAGVLDQNLFDDDGLTRCDALSGWSSHLCRVWEAAMGYYGGAVVGAVYRFETRLTLPGTLLRTNGTADGRTVHWVFRGRDLAQRDVTMQSESVEPNTEALVGLGARRDFDAPELLRLTDLLTRPRSGPELLELLQDALDSGNLKPLREHSGDSEIEIYARELAELLDPDGATVR